MVCELTEIDTFLNPIPSSSTIVTNTTLHNNHDHNKIMQHNRWRVDQLFEGCRLKVDNVSGRSYSKR